MKLNSSDKLKLAVLLIVAWFFLFTAAVFFIVGAFNSNQAMLPVQPIASPAPKYYRQLDGLPVSQEKMAVKPIAVILENHFEARPVSGLESASLVYEMVVEGDITRFLAIFDPQVKAKKIGPVRSVRPFLVELAEDWGAVLFHAGGSDDAMYKLTYSDIDNVNEISADGIYFWRDTSRSRPHNLYTSIDLIKRAIQAKEFDPIADFSPWLFKDDESQESRQQTASSTEIIVDFLGNPLYQVAYQYNPKANDYTRYLNGQVHKTDQGIILKTRNIIVQHVKSKILDDYGRRQINLGGHGLAEVYQDGKEIFGRWQRVDKRTRFYDLAGKEIEFNRGVIWVELVFD